MAKKSARVILTLQNSEGEQITTYANTRNLTGKLELNKYSKKLRKVTLFKQVKTKKGAKRGK